jgi:transposase
MDRLPRTKINVIRRHFLKGEVNGAKIAGELGIQRDTVYKYFKEFKEIGRLYPNKLKDFTFDLPKPARPKHPFHDELKHVLPDLIEQATTTTLERLGLWQQYRVLYPNGCGLYFFCNYFNVWLKENNICRYHHRRIKHISPEDRKELVRWRNSNDTGLWRKAVVILGSEQKRPIAEMSLQLEVTEETMLLWIERYKKMGLERLRDKIFTPDPKKVASSKIKQENILKLLQQTPRIHNVNRASWSLAALSKVYGQVYGTPLGDHSIGDHLKKMGYQFLKSRERLTSPDPLFREKMDKIKGILANLQPDEKFFSIDEYGPAVVNMKTGWSITAPGETKTVPQLQRIRGWYIMTAALELSTNQVTHFYSPNKNTEEMIRLTDVLCQQYKGNCKLYLSWDAASWHTSKKLYAHITKINEESYRAVNGTPQVELAPLPSSAQYLNIIESVFSGMAKSVIHNSDYACLEECKAALDWYFEERNAYFRANPKKAGKKIWGNEIVKPVFSETNNCKSRLKIRRKLPDNGLMI